MTTLNVNIMPNSYCEMNWKFELEFGGVKLDFLEILYCETLHKISHLRERQAIYFYNQGLYLNHDASDCNPKETS